MIRALLELCRISNLPTVWTNVIAAWIIATGGIWRVELLGLLIGASLVYCAGMILNDACDAAWDRDHRPERPIPSGRISRELAWALGIWGLIVGYFVLIYGGGARPAITAALIGAILLYDVYHKPWAGSVIVMGACRTLLYLTAGSAAAERGYGPLWTLLIPASVVIGLYIVGLSLVARREAAPDKPGKVWFWVGLVALLSPCSVFILEILLRHFGPGAAVLDSHQVSGELWGMFSAPTLWPLPLLLCGLVAWAIRLMRTPPPSNIGNAVGWLLAGIPLVDSIAIVWRFPLCLVFVALVPLLRLWQRWIAAT